jgi:hypothetical protein
VEDVSAELTPAQLADVKDHMHASEVLAAAKPGKVSRDSLASVAGKAAHNRVNKATTKKAAKSGSKEKKRQKWKEESLVVGLFLMAGLKGESGLTLARDAAAKKCGVPASTLLRYYKSTFKEKPHKGVCESTGTSSALGGSSTRGRRSTGRRATSSLRARTATAKLASRQSWRRRREKPGTSLRGALRRPVSRTRSTRTVRTGPPRSSTSLRSSPRRRRRRRGEGGGPRLDDRAAHVEPRASRGASPLRGGGAGAAAY